jgi:hypothetical protein
MENERTCPKASEREHPPRDDDLIDEACWDCPSLLREIDERGNVSFYCLVYRNRFRALAPGFPIVAPPRREASWQREKLDAPEQP